MFSKMRLAIIALILAAEIVIIAFSSMAGMLFIDGRMEDSAKKNLAPMADIAEGLAERMISQEKYQALLMASQIAADLDGDYSGENMEALFAANNDTLMAIGGNAYAGYGTAIFARDGDYFSVGGAAMPKTMEGSSAVMSAFGGVSLISSTSYDLSGRLVMYVCVPFLADLSDGGDNPVVTHVLALTINGLTFDIQLSAYHVWETGGLFLYDGNGYTMANRNKPWVQDRFNLFQTADADERYAAASASLKKALAGEKVQLTFQIGDVAQTAAFSPINSPEGWCIGAIAPLAESPLSGGRASMVMVTLAGLALGLVVAFVASYFIEKPYINAKKMRELADMASRSKSAFLANMSHEMRTPLNAVIGLTDLAYHRMSECGNDAACDLNGYMTKIKASALGLFDIINDVLDLSKIEAGKVEIENIPFRLRDVFSKCEAVIGLKAAEKGVHLHIYAEPSVERKLIGDPTKLRQILLNLLSNAVKFTNIGTVKLSATLTGQTEKGLSIMFEVRDSGIGMTADQLKRVFQPFTQGDESTTRKYGGTGLGLSIVKDTVELMGGKLVAESAKGIGSRFAFTLTFPLSDVPDVPDYEGAPAAQLKNGENPHFVGNVFVCEDNELNQEVVGEYLKRAGLTYTCASDGAEGSAAIKEADDAGKPYDLILMDIQMPIMDGWDATAFLRERGVKTPIVAMTANVMEYDGTKYLKHGFDGYLPKPFLAVEMWACLAKFLKEVEGEGGKDDKNGAAESAFFDGRGVIDGRLGLQRSGENAKLYARLRMDFLKIYFDQRDKILALLNEGDRKSAHRAAHTIKGAAGLIGAADLQTQAAELEAALAPDKAGDATIELAAFGASLNQVITVLRSEALQAADALIAEAKPLIELGDACAAGLTDRFDTVLTVIDNDLAEKLIEQTRAFDFDAAVETLAELERALRKEADRVER